MVSKMNWLPFLMTLDARWMEKGFPCLLTLPGTYSGGEVAEIENVFQENPRSKQTWSMSVFHTLIF